MAKTPRLRLIAGPNGSGKTTLTKELREVYKLSMGEYINPDDIAQNEFRHIPDLLEQSALAQKKAVERREQFLSEGKSLSYESVMSHESHYHFARKAKQAGYRLYFYYICLYDKEENVQRVQSRFLSQMGHTVPEEKIRKRFSLSLKNVFPMAQLADRAYFFDNSVNMTLIAEVENGQLRMDMKRINQLLDSRWFYAAVFAHWPKDKVSLIQFTP